MKNKQREPGYYWVLCDGYWEVAQYVKAGISNYEIDNYGNLWLYEGRPITESYFHAINETRIKSPDEQ